MSLPDIVLDHIAIATKDIERSVKIFEDLGLKFSNERELVETEKVETAFAQVDQNSHLELLKPINNEGPIQKFIDRNGEGIHHLCFRVQDVERKTQELKGKGFQLIYESPRSGANNCLVNFIHPKSTGGVLIEISQKLPEETV